MHDNHQQWSFFQVQVLLLDRSDLLREGHIARVAQSTKMSCFFPSRGPRAITGALRSVRSTGDPSRNSFNGGPIGKGKRWPTSVKRPVKSSWCGKHRVIVSKRKGRYVNVGAMELNALAQGRVSRMKSTWPTARPLWAGDKSKSHSCNSRARRLTSKRSASRPIRSRFNSGSASKLNKQAGQQVRSQTSRPPSKQTTKQTTSRR